MITIRKLRTLKPGTLRRKTAVILQAFEQQIKGGRRPGISYLIELTELISEVFPESPAVGLRASGLGAAVSELQPEELLRRINGLRHEILKVLGTEPADWDMDTVHGAGECRGGRSGRFDGVRVFLDDLRSPFNIGSVFRTSEAFGVSEIILSPDCPSPAHPRAQRTSMGCTEIVDWRVEELDSAVSGEYSAGIFALELGGTAVSEFEFPEQGTVIIGSEELGISPEARAAAQRSLGLVTIPVYGSKGSINVSTAFGILMQRWAESLADRVRRY